MPKLTTIQQKYANTMPTLTQPTLNIARLHYACTNYTYTMSTLTTLPNHNVLLSICIVISWNLQ